MLFWSFLWSGDGRRPAAGDYKVLAWCYSVRGIAGANHTGPIAAPNTSHNRADTDPEFMGGRGVVMLG